MIGSDGHEGALLAGDDEGPAGGAKSVAVVGGAEHVYQKESGLQTTQATA